jgi:hypothetical protein
MRRIARPIVPAALVTVLLLTEACSKPEGPKPSSEAGVPAPATTAPYLTRIEEIRVEYRPVEVPNVMPAGSRVVVRFEATNTGSTTWPAHGTPPFRFGYHWADPEGRGTWDSVVWDDGSRGDLTAEVPPGGKVTITLPVKAPPGKTKHGKLIIVPLFETNGGWSVKVPYVATIDIT